MPLYQPRSRHPNRPAAKQLRKWRKAKGLRSFADAGRELGVPWFRYRRWELGESVPLVADMLMLEKKCGVAAEAWAEGT